MTPARRPTGPTAALVGRIALALALMGLVACGPATVENGKGRPVPNIVDTTLDGQAFDLASLRGKPVLINFWGPWCGPCLMEMPELLKLERKYRDRADVRMLLGTTDS